ncbi:MAG: hypothetical protein AAFO86_04515 [Pseudomonadota bacterium]
MDDPTPLYAYLSRNLETINGKPRFTGFMPADDRTSDLMSEKGPIAPGRPLRFIMDELDLRRKDNWPGEVGHINVSGTIILVSAAVRDRILARAPSGISLSAAVLEDINGQFIEPLYHLSVYERQDVWDREKSEYLVPFDPDRDKSANLDSIVLDAAAVANLSETARLILRLAKVSPPAILFDAAFVADLAREGLTLGAEFYPLPDWFDGIEYQ